MPIPTTDKRLISICGSQQGVSNLNKFMVKLGLIGAIDINSDDYIPYYYTKNHKGRGERYYYYYENEQKLVEYCKQNSINRFEKERKVHTDVLIQE